MDREWSVGLEVGEIEDGDTDVVSSAGEEGNKKDKETKGAGDYVEEGEA